MPNAPIETLLTILRRRFAIEPLEARTHLSFSATHTVNLPGAGNPIATGYLQGVYNPIDLVVGSTGEVNVLLGNGDGTFSQSQSIPLPANAAAQKPFVVGAFGGSTTDMVLLSQASITHNGLVTYETNSANGVFSQGATGAIQNGGNGFAPLSAVAGDFNDDGNADLAVVGKATSSPNLVLAILLSNGDGTFTESADYPIAGSNAGGNVSDEPIVTGSFAGQTGLALLDGSSGQLDIFIGNNSGAFTQKTPVSVAGSLIIPGIFTGSGNTDIVTAGGNDLEVYLGAGDGTFTAQPPIALSGPITALASADFNLDGNRDLVTNLGVQLGNGDGTFQSPVALPVNLDGGGGTSGTLLAVDLNHDGKPDIAGFDAAGNAVDIAINSSLAATALSVTSSKTPANPGDDVQFTATVSTAASGNLSGNPTGQVTFYDASAVLGVEPLQSNGTATLDAGTALAIGLHPITVLYSGDSIFAASTSSVLTQSILAATVTTLTSSEAPSLYADNVTFTATVTGSDGLGGSPSGTVEFIDGTNGIGSGFVTTSGIAVFSTAELAVATHSITAYYSGDNDFAGSTSAAVNQIVNTPTLEPEATRSTLPANTIAGVKQHGIVAVSITNTTAASFAGPVTVQVYLCPDDAIDSLAIGITSQTFGLNLRAQKVRTVNVRIASVPVSVPEGSYLVLAQLIYNGAIDTSNSITGPAAVILARVIALTETITPLGVPRQVVAGVHTAAAVRVTVTNNGNIPDRGFTAVVDASTVAGQLGIALGKMVYHGVLPSQSSRSISFKLGFPASLIAGSYYLVATCTDQLGQTSNVSSAATIVVAAPFVSLTAAASVVGSTAVSTGKTVRVAVALTNTGNIPANGPIEFTAGPTTDGSSFLAAWANIPGHIAILPGGARRIILVVKVPAGTDPGAISLLVVCRAVGETGTATVLPELQISG